MTGKHRFDDLPPIVELARKSPFRLPLELANHLTTRTRPHGVPVVEIHIF